MSSIHSRITCSSFANNRRRLSCWSMSAFLASHLLEVPQVIQIDLIMLSETSFLSYPADRPFLIKINGFSLPWRIKYFQLSLSAHDWLSSKGKSATYPFSDSAYSVQSKVVLHGKLLCICLQYWTDLIEIGTKHEGSFGVTVGLEWYSSSILSSILEWTWSLQVTYLLF